MHAQEFRWLTLMVASERSRARDVFDEFSALINVTFVEASEDESANIEIYEFTEGDASGFAGVLMGTEYPADLHIYNGVPEPLEEFAAGYSSVEAAKVFQYGLLALHIPGPHDL